jgi:carbon storage regulator
MLVLRRKAGEAIVLNGTITIHVLAVEGERVKLGISAPPEVVIVRSELLEGQEAQPQPAAAPVPVGVPTAAPQLPRDPGDSFPGTEAASPALAPVIQSASAGQTQAGYATAGRPAPRRRAAAPVASNPIRYR